MLSSRPLSRRIQPPPPAENGMRRRCREKLEGCMLSPTPTERASLSAISLRHIIWLPHESYAGMSLPLAVCGAGIWLRQGSLIILASPGNGIHPWDNRGKCYLDRKRIQYNTIQYNTIKYLYSAYSHRVSRTLRRRELISNVQKGRF